MILKRESAALLDRFAGLVCPMGEGDWGLFRDFIDKHFHERYVLGNEGFFRWQYRENPYSFLDGFAMRVLREGERFLGFLGLVPYRMKVFDESHGRCGALCNLMIDASCRSLGLGAVLVKSCQGDFDLMTGTDYNPKTARMYKGIGNWIEMGDLRRFLCILDPDACAALENPVRPRVPLFRSLSSEAASVGRSGAELDFFEVFDESVADLWDRVRDRYPIAVERSAAYLNWRYARHPMLKYDLVGVRHQGRMRGYIVSRRERASEAGHRWQIDRIVDLVAEEEVEAAMLASYLEWSRKAGSDCADFCFTGSIPAESLRRAGFTEDIACGVERLPHVFSPIERDRAPINFITYAGDQIGSKAGLRDVANWYITRGEGDKDRPNIPPPRGVPG